MTQEEFRAWADKNAKVFFAAAKCYFKHDPYEHVGDVYEMCARKIGSYDPSRGSLTTFIYNQAYGLRRGFYRKAYRSVDEISLADWSEETVASPEHRIDDLLMVDEALKHLSDKQRRCAECLIRGDSVTDIGIEINVSKQYAWQVVKRVREIAQRMAAA